MNRREFLAVSAAAVALAPYSAWAGEPAHLIMSGALGLAAVSLNASEPHRFLVDTGAAATVVDQTLSGVLGVDRMLPRTGPVRAKATGLSLAGQTAFVTPVIADLSGISAALGQPVKGLLGSDFFSGFNVTIDMAAGTLQLDAGKMVKRAGAMALRFDGIPYVRAEVRANGQRFSGEFGLDTGLDTGLKVFARRAPPGFSSLDTVPGQTLTMSGLRPQALARADAVRLGGLDILNPTLNLSNDDPPKGARAETMGMIGAPAFLNRVLTLDFPGGWWSLSPVML